MTAKEARTWKAVEYDHVHEWLSSLGIEPRNTLKEMVEAYVNPIRQALAEAAMEINCAGPVAHRIRVMKREYKELLDKKDKRIKEQYSLIWKDRI